MTYKQMRMAMLPLNFPVSPLPLRAPHLWIQPITDQKYFKKNSRRFQEANLEFATHHQFFLPSIYTVFATFTMEITLH